MADFSYDLVVIGSGPAGEGAAINAVKQGLRVAVVDEKLMPGGNCTPVSYTHLTLPTTPYV